MTDEPPNEAMELTKEEIARRAREIAYKFLNTPPKRRGVQGDEEQKTTPDQTGREVPKGRAGTRTPRDH